MYDYYDAVIKDVRKYIDDHYDLSNYYGVDPDYLIWDLQEDEKLKDFAIGKPNGFNVIEESNAKKWVFENMDELLEACNEGCYSDEMIGEKFLCQEWIWFDSLIRFYFIDSAIDCVVEEYVSEHVI